MSLKKFKFQLKIQRGWPSILPKKRLFATKTDRNARFLGHKSQILDWLHILILYISFYGFKKFKFWLKIQRGYPSVLLKNVGLWQKLIETLYFLVVNPIFWIGYT
jgi:hypothetical protein